VIDTYKLIYPHIEFEFDTSSSISVYTNANALKRIVDNIVSNSCKYSKKENPKVTITVDTHHLTIEDNGKGIKYPQNVFSSNYTENANTNGHGIGMYIVHRLCSALSYQINIESKEGIGTKIKLVF
jgi:two-component system OmpR family sensor kinase